MRQIGLGQAERFRLGSNTYHPFAFPELKRISNILNARIGCQSLFQFCRRRLQSFQIRTAQSNVNRLACGEHISAETDFRNSGYVAHGRPPAIGNLLAGDGAFLRGRNFNVHFSLVAAKMVCLIVTPGEFRFHAVWLHSDGRQYLPENICALRAFGQNIRTHAVGSILNFFGRNGCLLCGGASRIGHVGVNVVALHGWKKNELDVSARITSQHNGQHRHASGHGEVTPSQAGFQERLVNAQCKFFSTIRKPLLKPRPQARFLGLCRGQIAQVCGQDEQAFNQREKQRGYDNQRNETQDFPSVPLQRK